MTKRLYSLSAALIAVGLCWNAGPASAQQMLDPTPTPEKVLFDAQSKEPDVNAVPILKNIVAGDAKLYYLGERSGMPGWFILKKGQVQMIYLSPDHKSAIIGAMFSSEGDNVTGEQIKALASRDRSVYALLNGAGQTQEKITEAGSPDGGVTAVESDPAAAKAPKDALPTATLSPGDRLYQDLEAASGVELGKGQGPVIQIVVAPKCPNCKATWGELREAVKNGQVRVRLIPVYNSMGGEEAEMSAQLLRAKDPFDAWDKHVAGDATALAGKADEIAMKAVTANLNLVAKWNIKGYPYLVYRSKDGKVKIVQGRPERMAAVLLDLTR